MRWHLSISKGGGNPGVDPSSFLCDLGPSPWLEKDPVRRAAGGWKDGREEGRKEHERKGSESVN